MPINTIEPYKKIYRGGIVMYVILLVFSIICYKERMIMLDDAYYLFNVVRTGNFSVEHNRFIAVFTEILPLLAVKMSLSLKSITVIYSAGLMLYYFGCYVLCGSVLKNYRIAIVLLLYQVLISTHTFFWTLSEFTQGIALMLVFIALIQKRTDSYKPAAILYLLSVLIIVTLVFAHPLMIIPFSFTMIFMLMNDKKENRRKYTGAIFIYLFVYVVKHFFFEEQYDTKSMSAGGSIFKLFPHYFDIVSNRRFLKNCVYSYYMLPLLSVAVSAIYIKQGQYKKLALFLSYLLGYLFLVNVTFWYGVPDFYIENLYLPLGLIVGLPAVYTLLPSMKPYYAYWLTAAICMAAIIRILVSHEFYSSRIDWLRTVLDKYEGQKIIVDERVFPQDKLLMSWGTPYEFWLLSTIEEGKSASVLVTDKDKIKELAQPVMWENKSMITTYGVLDYNILPAQYFIFTDTVSKYKLVQ